MRLTNLYGLPQPIVSAVAADDYNRGVANISVTSLISPPRQVALTEAHSDELEEDASDRIYSLFGRAIHKILESKEETATAEQRLYMKVGDWTVSGAMDRIALLPWNDGTVCISDYKTAKTDELMRGVKIEREQQLNCYRVLAELNGYKVGALQAVFILRDWSKVRAATEAKKPKLGSTPAQGEYPRSQVVIYDLPVWPIEQAYAYIAERVAVHKDAQTKYLYARTVVTDTLLPPEPPQSVLPECDEEERWARPPVLAVQKPGAKRASKLVDTQEEAAEYIAAHPKDTYEVVPRPGESIRCSFYCSASSVCEQFKAEVAGAGS